MTPSDDVGVPEAPCVSSSLQGGLWRVATRHARVRAPPAFPAIIARMVSMRQPFANGGQCRIKTRSLPIPDGTLRRAIQQRIQAK